MAVGSALGQGSFSWRGVAAGAVAGGLTAGASSALAGSSAFTTSAGELTTLGRTAQGVASYGAGVVGNATAGRDTAFSWNAVAAAALGSAASAKLGGRVSQLQAGGSSGQIAKDTLGYFVNSASHATARRAMGLGNQDWDGMAVDAFGNALGNAAVRNGGSAPQAVSARTADADDSFLSRHPRAMAALDGGGVGDALPEDIWRQVNDPNWTRSASDEAISLMEADIAKFEGQGRDMTATRAELESLRSRRYAPDAVTLDTVRAWVDRPTSRHSSKAGAVVETTQ